MAPGALQYGFGATASSLLSLFKQKNAENREKLRKIANRNPPPPLLLLGQGPVGAGGVLGGEGGSGTCDIWNGEIWCGVDLAPTLKYHCTG